MLRTSLLFMLAVCGVSASSWSTVGGYDIWIEGEHVDLTKLNEVTRFAPGDTSEPPYFTTYSNTPYKLEGLLVFSGSGDTIPVVGDDALISDSAIELIGAPEDMTVGSGDYEEQYVIEWVAPFVAEATAFTFTIQAKIFSDGNLVETLQGDLTLTVLPALPMLEENLLTQGIRAQDGGEQYDLSLDVYDPDEASHVSQLTLETQDPRFTFETETEDDWLNWTLRWNSNHSAPQVSELIPLRFWMRDWDGFAERWTSVQRNVMLFGYGYETDSMVSPTPEADVNFGKSVELSNILNGQPATAFVQDPGSFDIHIYEKSEPSVSWQWMQTLTSPEDNDDFGGSMSSAGDLLAIGCADPDYSLDCRVYLYRRSADTGLWSLIQTLIPDDETLGGVFGGEVALDNTSTGDDTFIYTLMVSADGAESQGEHTGAAWVYEADDPANPVFTKSQIIVPADAEAGDYFGWPLALHGNLAAIPSNEDDDIAEDSGAVYVYLRNAESGLWEQQQKLKADDADYGDLFGERVAISDRGIFVSAFRKWQDNTRVGAVYQFEKGAGGWEQTRRIRSIEEASLEEYVYYDYTNSMRKEYILRHFGSSLVAEGDSLFVCGQRQGYGWLTLDRSVVYQFEWNDSTNEWIEQRALCSRDSDVPDAGTWGSNLGNGQALAVRDGVILAGDFGADASGLEDSGKVYSFSTATTPLTEEFHDVHYFEQLAIEAPGRERPEDDADGDGKSNLVELYAGTDPMEGDNLPPYSASHSDHPNLPTFTFLSNPHRLEQRPGIKYSHTLEAGSWQELTDARYLPDTLVGDSIRKTIDLSHMMHPELPLFLKLNYPKID